MSDVDSPGVVPAGLEESDEPPDLPDHPNLLKPSMFAAGWWISVVPGLALVTVALYQTLPELGDAKLAFWMIAGLLFLFEFFPVIIGSGYDSQGVATSDAFVFATLYLFGAWPAIALISCATLGSEVAKRKPLWKVPYNIGNFALSVGSAALLMSLVRGAAGEPIPTLADPLSGLEPTDLTWIVAGWLSFFFVNNTLFSMLADPGRTFADDFFEDFGYYFFTNMAVLAVAPLVVFVSAEPIYLPLLLLPLYAVRKTASISREKEHQALHDSLTGLPNRKMILTELGSRLEEARRRHARVAFCLLDLDRFKEVNDTLGHQVGDRLLAVVAQRIQGALRPNDLVARLGGDEFAILLDPVRNQEAAVEVAHRVRQALTRPFHVEGMLFELEASIGVAVFPEHGEDVDPIVRRADVAMYLAKEERTGVEVYVADRDRNSASRLALLGGLRNALENGDLRVHFQPKVALSSGAVVGVEALVRWHHPQRGLVMPDEFIPMAEHSGLMAPLTEHVIDESLAQVARWRQAGLEIPVAVNVSMRDLHGRDLVGVVATALERHDLPASMLMLELTERVLTRDSGEVDATLNALRRIGVAASLDDFGTGYSSMVLLKRLPISEIKIDRSFVSRLTADPGDVTIVASIVELAHGLGMTAVAEGVESEQVWDLLQDLGCDAVQGWYVSRPLDADNATAWLLRHPSQQRALRVLRGGAEGASGSA
ncbi:MAG TPA: EAL domain-containing protein [Actinomycetes bacterium]|nr:EAL domain-containing protein [Actinomycetes bacterium]